MKRAAILILALFFSAGTPGRGFAVSLDELTALALKNHNALKEQESRREAQRNRYQGSFDPYYPSLDLSLGIDKYMQSAISPSLEDRQFYSASLQLGYKLYDPRRQSVKNAQQFSLNIEEHSFAVLGKEIARLIKDLYARILAEKMTHHSRTESFEASKKTHELALAKREVGVAKISEVYEARVRMENIRLDLVSTLNSLHKLVYEMSSLTERKLSRDDFVEELSPFTAAVGEEMLFGAALERRDEIRKEELVLKKIEEDKTLASAEYLPQATVALNYSRFENAFFPSPDETRLGLGLTWNLFSGPGKSARSRAADRDIASQQFRIAETKRAILLDVKKAFEDLNTNIEKVAVSDEILKSARQTYDQTYEEYRVGKGDILSLLQAEINLSAAREGRIAALLGLHLSRNTMERAVGVNSLKELQ